MSAWFARGSSRPRWRWLALPVIVLCLANGLSGKIAANASARPPIDPPRVGYPNEMAALGDSLTVAANSAPGLPNTGVPANGWSTGSNSAVQSHYLRILQAHPAVSGNVTNTAVYGNEMDQLQAQIDRLQGLAPEYATILIGGNNLCRGQENAMTPTVEFRDDFLDAMTSLTQMFSDTGVYVVSIPDVYKLWQVSRNNSNAVFVWNFANVCPAMLANPTSDAPADEARRQRVRQRNIDYNTALGEVCAQFIHCRFDNSLVFNTSFSASDIGTIDYFHPSVAGQTRLSQVTYADTFDFTDTVAPTSTATITPDGELRQIALAGADDVALAGIEYRVGGGRWTRYGAPFSVDAALPVVYRAVDVNGNIEGSHLVESLDPEPEYLIYLPLLSN